MGTLPGIRLHTRVGFLQATYEETQREAAGVAHDVSRLRAYESRDTSNVVEVMESGGPTHMAALTRDAEGYIECFSAL